MRVASDYAITATAVCGHYHLAPLRYWNIVSSHVGVTGHGGIAETPALIYFCAKKISYPGPDSEKIN